MPEPTRFPETTQEYLEWVSYWEKSPASYKPDKFYIKAAEKMNYDVELVKEFLAKRRGSLAQEVVEESKASPSSLDWDWGEDELSLDRIEEKPSEKQPLSADEKPQRNETAEIIRTPVETIKTPKEDPQELQGWNDIVKYLEAGVALIGVYENCAQVRDYNKEYAESFSNDINVVRTLWDGNDIRTKGQREIRRFYFIPKNVGWLCLDVDCKNGKDGLQDFYRFCERQGKPREKLPPYLQELPISFPCWVRSANNGFHLYFKCDEEIQEMNKLPDCSAVEIKYTNNLVPAGSFKSGRPYILHGDLAKIPELPDFLKTVIFEHDKSLKRRDRPLIKPSKKTRWARGRKIEKREFGKPSWEQISKWTDQDDSNRIAGRNDRAFGLARHAKTHKYTAEETFYELSNDPSVNDLPEKELRSVVKSVFKGA